TRRHGKVLVPGDGQDGGDMIDGGRPDDPARRAAVDGRGGQRGRIDDEPVGPETLGEDSGHRRRGDWHQIQAPAGSAGRLGRKPSPQAGWDGSSLSGFMRPAGSKIRRSRNMKFRSASPYWSGMFLALSRPTPCSPVTEPPSAMHAPSNSS